MPVMDDTEYLRARLHEYQDLERERAEGHKLESLHRRKANARASYGWGLVAVLYFVLALCLREGYIDQNWGVMISFLSAIGAVVMSVMARS